MRNHFSSDRKQNMEKYISLRKAQQKKETENWDFDGKEKRYIFCTEFDMKKHRYNQETNKMKFERERKVNETSKQEEAKKEREQMERGWTKGGHKEEKKSF